MAKKYTPEIKEKVTTIWIWKQKAWKNELKTKHSVNSAPRDILEEAINIAEINCDNNENQNYKEEFLNQQQAINLLSVNINKQIENNYFDNSEEDSDSERLVIDEDYKEEVNIWRPWEELEIKQNSEESLVIELKKDQLKYIRKLSPHVLVWKKKWIEMNSTAYFKLKKIVWNILQVLK